MRFSAPITATVVLSLAACGGGGPSKAADATDESTDVAAEPDVSAEDEDAVIVTECDGLDQFTCEITGGCQWSAEKKSCGEQKGR